MATPPVTELSDRARAIFRLVVEGYLESGQPVGSKTLASDGALNLSPASIRSVLAEDPEQGKALLEVEDRIIDRAFATERKRPSAVEVR